jgi:hypothetical protein
MDECLPCWGLTRPTLNDLSHDDFFDRTRIYAGARHGFTDDHGAELGSSKRGESAEITADRSADGRDDDWGGTITHGTLIRFGLPAAKLDGNPMFVTSKTLGTQGTMARLRTSSLRRSMNAPTVRTSCFFPAPRTLRARLSDSASRCPITAIYGTL